MGRASVVRQSPPGDSTICDAATPVTVTIGAADAALLAAPGATTERRFLLIQNAHATQDLWVTLDGSAATAASPAVLIPAKQILRFDGGFVPSGAIRAIASGAATPVTVITG